MTTKRTIPITILAGTLLALAPSAGAADKAALKCRSAIARQGAALVGAGLRALDACHVRQDKKGGTGGCDVVDLSRARERLAAAAGRACRKAPDVLANFLGNDPATAIAGIAADEIGASGRTLQGAPEPDGDRAKLRCRRAIGKGRSGVVKGVIRGAVGCQRGRDKTSGALGALAADCAAGTPAVAGKATTSIASACGTMPGPEVGSCEPLPGCVVDSAAATGRSLAATLFRVGSRGPECGDGVMDEGEECDPGSLVSDTCVGCRVRGCGDGFVDVAADEECDDANTTAGDGCSGTCKVEVPAGGTLVTVTVALTHDPALTGDVAGVELTVDYPPAKVALPGSGNVPATGGRVANEGSPEALFAVSDRDTDVDGSDDQLFLPYGLIPVLPPGPLVRVVFDGLPGAEVTAADFPCAVQTAVDQMGASVSGVTCAVGVSVAVVTPTTSTTTVPTATTTSTTVVTSTTTTSTTVPGSTTTTSTTIAVTTTTSTSTSTTTTTVGGGAVCGDGIVEGDEECDDGNDVSTDACTSGCRAAWCGDGITWAGVEQCDPPLAGVCSAGCAWLPAVCGDGKLQFGETCDDGNTENGDACPSDCRIELCLATGVRQTVSVTYTKPGAVTVGGLAVFVTYPDGVVGLPGLGNVASVRARITNLPAGFTHVVNDLDYAFREVLAAQTTGSQIPAGQLFRVSFDTCVGALAPTAGQFQCQIESASTPQGQDIDLGANPMSCAVTIL